VMDVPDKNVVFHALTTGYERTLLTTREQGRI